MLLNTLSEKNSHMIESPRIKLAPTKPITRNPFANKRRSETVKSNRYKVLQLRRDQVTNVRKASIETTKESVYIARTRKSVIEEKK